MKDIFLSNTNLIECYEGCRETGRNTEHEEQKLLVGTPFAYMNQHLKMQKTAKRKRGISISKNNREHS